MGAKNRRKERRIGGNADQSWGRKLGKLVHRLREVSTTCLGSAPKTTQTFYLLYCRKQPPWDTFPHTFSDLSPRDRPKASSFFFPPFFPFSFPTLSLAPFEGRLLHRNDYNFSQKVSIIVIVRGFTVDSVENATISRRERKRGRVSRETTVCEYPGTLSIYVLFSGI